MRDTFQKELINISKKNKNLMLLTADLGFGVFDEFEKKFPKKYLNVGVAEQNLIGVSTGLAMNGKIVIAYSIANFLTLRCLEQIRNDAVYHNLNINLVSSGGGYTYGVLGMSHHATEDLSVLNCIPGIIIVAPSTKWETKEALKKLLKIKGTTYLRLEKNASNLIPKDAVYSLGNLNNYSKGSKLAIICVGGIFSECIAAVEILKKKKTNISLYTLSSLKPIDEIKLIKTLKRYRVIITVEENNFLGGLGSTIASIITKYSIKCIHKIVSTNDKTLKIVGDQEFLRKQLGMDANSLVSKVESLIKKF
jgi:transketolase